MKNIGIIHFKVGGTDGVSLEINKWKQVFEELGHNVYLCGGDLGKGDGTLIEEIYHHTAVAKRLYTNTFIALTDYDEVAYHAELYDLAEQIEKRLKAWIEEKEINFLVPQNVWSVAMNHAVAIAVTRIMRDLQLPALAHNHDFYWERVNGVALTCKTAVDLADFYLPPRDPLAKHVVINSLAQQSLLARKGISATVVPNVFDFDAPHWAPDDYNADFRERIGLGENDIFLLQATRIIPRKGIELAIDVVAALNTPEKRAVLKERGLWNGRDFTSDSRIVLVLAGYAEDDLTGKYVNQLKHRILEAEIDALFIEDFVASERQTRDGQKIYSLWDTYAYADLVTYPSLWEGWGNQLLEAIRAELPILLFEYPVYGTDIKRTGLSAVSLGNKFEMGEDGLAYVPPEVIATAADATLEMLIDKELRQQVVEHNFQIGQQQYSMQALKLHLAKLLAEFD